MLNFSKQLVYFFINFLLENQMNIARSMFVKCGEMIIKENLSNFNHL